MKNIEYQLFPIILKFDDILADDLLAVVSSIIVNFRFDLESA